MSVTYYYVGNPFVPTVGLGVSVINGDVTAIVVYNGPGDFSFTLNAPGLSLSSTTNPELNEAQVFDVQNGIPVSWALDLGLSPAAPTAQQIDTNNASGYGVIDAIQYTLPSGEIAYGQIQGSPGVWTTTPPPPPPQVPR